MIRIEVGAGAPGSGAPGPEGGAGGERGRSGPSYPVLIGRGLLEGLPAVLGAGAPADRYAVISDSNVAPLHGARATEILKAAGLEAELFSFPAGEASKSRTEWARLTDALLSAGMDRSTVVLAVGGGVTGDLAGFVAATFLRGVRFVQIPTSLLAMVDASIGGKTGVDVPAGKNLVGAFHAPALVLADPDLLATLSPAERIQGLVEAAKHGAIRDRAHLDEVHASATAVREGDIAVLESLVARSVRIKAEVVTEDYREGGLRQILNFGHTLGHSIEAASRFGIPHGTAVSLGMILEARVGERMGVTAPGTALELARVMSRFGLPTTVPREFSPDELLRWARTDKKNRAGVLRFVLLSEPGRVDPGEGWAHPIGSGVVKQVLEESQERATPF